MDGCVVVFEVELMKISPTLEIPPRLYQLSRVLSPPSRRMTTDGVIQRLRRFHRDGLIQVGAHLLWNFWENPRLVGTDSFRVGNYVTRMYAERIIVLACIFASPCNRPWPTIVDFQLLCWEMFHCSEGDFLGPEAERQMVECLQKVDKDSPLRKLSAVHARDLLVEAFKARNVTVQFCGRYLRKDEYIRPLLIAREIRSFVGGQGGEEDGVYYESKFFLTSLERFFRAAWALFMKACSEAFAPLEGLQDSLVAKTRGRIDSSDWPPDDKVLVRMGLTGDDLRAVASRLASSLSYYQGLRSEVLRHAPELRKYISITDWLAKRPLIDLEIGGRCERLFAPSPWRVLSAVGECMLYDYVAFLQENRHTALDGRDAYSIRGRAYENYLREFLRGYSDVYDLDKIDGVERSQARTDFLWVGREYGVLIEAKFSLRPNEDRGMKDVAVAVETWRRAAEPIKQARGFLCDGLKSMEGKIPLPKKWVLAVVSNEDCIEDSVGFKGVARMGNLLEGTGLDALVVLNTSEFEDWVAFGSPDEFARKAVQVWLRLNPGEVDYDARVSRQSDRHRSELPHIDEAWKSLFPCGKEVGVEQE